MNNVIIFRLGLGEVTSTWGTYEGYPAVFIEPASPSGPVGELAPDGPKTSVKEGGLVLQFQKPDGAGILVEDIHSALEKFYGENPVK